MELLQQFRRFITDNNLFTKNDRLLLAVSGGVDSSVLCYLCKACGFSFEIAHCNFMLRGNESDRDAAFVSEIAKHYAVKFHLRNFDTMSLSESNKTSIEETARNLRYDWFHELLAGEGHEKLHYVVTAHHADDNVETVMMNFFRGTGLKGMRGIKAKRDSVVRPLLFSLKTDLETFAAENKISYITDSSNTENNFARNYFRNVIIPAVEKVYPQAKQNIISNSNRFAAIEKIFDQSIEQIKSGLCENKGAEVHIPVLKLIKLPGVQAILFEILSDYGFNAAQTVEAKKLLTGESGKYICSRSHLLLRNRKWLILSPLQATEDKDFYIIEKGQGQVILPLGEINISLCAGAKMPATPTSACLDDALLEYPLVLRKRKTGDYFYPFGLRKDGSGKQAKKKVSRFLSDLRLSAIEKDAVWILESRKRIVWVVGFRIDERFKVTPRTVNTATLDFRPASRRSTDASAPQ